MSAKKLIEAVRDKEFLVGVIGLGYVGLPLIDAFTKAGFSCLGFDIDSKKVECLKSGKSYIKHIGSAKIQSWLEQEHFEATTDMSRLSEPDAILICVPTPLDEARDPDLKLSLIHI